MTDAVVRAVDVRKSYPGTTRRDERVTVLRGIDLDVAAGELVAIVGPSGSGKSTLLYCLAGLEPADGGTVELAGADLARLGRGPLARLRRDHVGFVFQSFNLIPSLSARENVALPARLARRGIRPADVDAALARVGLADRARHLPAHLSGGQQQRVAIARVLAMGPDVVFADEPTGALDTEAGAGVLRLLREAADAGSAVVVVTHDLEAASQASRVLVLRDGAIHEELHAPSPERVLDAITRARAAA